MKEVLLVQKYISNYRVPLFEELSRSTDYKWRFAAASHPGDEASGTEAANPEIDIANTSLYSINLFGTRLYFHLGVISTILKYQPDAVIFDMSWPIVSNPLLVSECKCLGIPALGWAKGISEHENNSFQTYKRCFLNYVDAIITYGDTGAKALNNLQVTTDIYVARNSTRIQPFIEYDNENPSGTLYQSNFVVGYMGSLFKKKGIMEVLSSFSHLNRTREGCHLRIAGSGSMYDDIRAKIQHLNMGPNTTMDGYFDDEDKAKILSSFDVFVSPQHEGLSVIEAMASGTCVVVGTNRRPETELIEHGVNGVVLSETELDLSAVLVRLHDNPELTAKLAHNAQTTIRGNVSISNMVEGFRCALDAVMYH